jgi:hypothetical protein
LGKTKKVRERPPSLNGRIAQELNSTVAKLAIVALQIVCLTLLFPFHWPTFFGTIILLVATFVLYRRRGAGGVARRAWPIVAALTLVWAMLGPLSLPQSPIYVHTDAQAALLDARALGSAVLPLEGEGSLVFVVDPIRRYFVLPSLAALAPEKIRLLRERTVDGKRHIQIPLGRAFRMELPGTIGKSTTVFLPVFMPARSIKIEGSEGKVLGTFEAGFGLSSVMLFAYSESPSLGGGRWDLVQFADSSEDNLKYVSLVDLGIEHAANGETERATHLIERALKISPNMDETARLNCLLGTYLRHALGGSVGELQSLPLTHRGYDAVISVKPKESRGWLQRWVARELIRQYGSHRSLFSERIAMLYRDVLTEAAPGTAKPTSKKSSISLETTGDSEELMSLYRSFVAEELEEKAALGSVEAEQARIDALTPDQLRAELRRSKGIDKLMRLDLAVGGFAQRPFKLSRSIANLKVSILRDEISKLPSELSELYLRRLYVSKSYYDIHVAGDGSPEKLGEAMYRKLVDAVFEGLVNAKPFDNDYDRAYAAMMSGKLKEFPTIPMDPAARSSPWWSHQYQAWMNARLGDALRKLIAFNKGSLADLSANDLEQVFGDFDDFVVDGSGRPYIPAIFLLSRLTEAGGGRQHRFFVATLERTLEVKYPDLMRQHGFQPFRSSPPTPRVPPASTTH